jgi:hypothetical protein
MAKYTWSVLCAKSIVDQSDNSLTLVNTIDEIMGPAPPSQTAVVPFPMELVILSTRSNQAVPETTPARMRFINPAGQELGKVDFSVDLQKARRIRNFLKMEGIPIAGPGIYEFHVEFMNAAGTYDLVGTTPLEVTYATGAASG